MIHDLDNGKTKYLNIETTRVHTIVEGWAQGENVLGGADCHDDQRCRSCRDFLVLSGLQAARCRVAVSIAPLPSDITAIRDSEQAEPSDDPTTPAGVAWKGRHRA